MYSQDEKGHIHPTKKDTSDTTGTQNLLRENLSLKKYSNVITYENAQLKETLRREKGYWADTVAVTTEAPPQQQTTRAPDVKGP